MTAPLQITANNRTLVQTSQGWPADDAGWTTLEGAWAEDRSGGFCNDLGAAKFRYPFGKILRQGSAAVDTYSAPSLCGRYVRISEEDPAGPLIADDGTTFTPVWVGTISEVNIEPDANNLGFTYVADCVGILSLLDQAIPAVHFSTPQTGGTAADIGAQAEFNNVGGKKTGNRSAEKYDFGNGYSAYVFDFTSSGVMWNTYDIVEYVMAILHNAAPGGPLFSLAGQTESLSFQEKVSLSGSSCLEMMARMINPKQGHGFRPVYVYATNSVQIDVMSLSRVLIPVPDGNDIPANDRQKTIDLTPADGVSAWSVREIQTATYDEVNVVMAPNQYAVTLSLADMEPDWTAQEEIDMEELDEDDPAREFGAFDKVGRRFKLKADMSGTTLGGFTLPTGRVAATDSLHGAGGYTGELNDSGARSATGGMRFLKKLPMPSGYDWSTQDPTTADLRKEGMKPIAIVKLAGTNEHITLAEYCEMTDVQIEIDEDAASVTFGPANISEWILGMIAEGDMLYLTLGVEAQLNTIVSWNRAAGSRPRDKSRVLTKLREKLVRQFITPGIYLGVDEDGVLKTSPITAVTVRDDLPLALETLSILIPWYSESEWLLARTLRGTVDTTYEEGDLITEASYQFVDGSTVTLPVVGVITSVRRSYGDNGSVGLTTKRLKVDLEAVS